MKIGEILATKYVHPDIEKNLKKVEKRAKGSARMGYHSSMAYPFRVKGETKEAPAGTYFTKTGNLVKGRLSKDARERGARETDPKDSQRSKVPPVTQSNEDEHGEADFRLTNGEYKILQADDDKMTRGLAIRSNEDGSYDSYYWYEDPSKPMEIEIEVDGKSVAKDAKKVHWKYHPELEESWSNKYKKSINCSSPKGFSQKAHCAGRKKK
jgi:hypothetical protein